MTARPAAPPPPDLSEQPRTAAGQSLLRQWSGHVNEPEVRIVVLAIEAEAEATAAADAWQAGYEACWNRLKDAGRLLPSGGAAVCEEGRTLCRACHLTVLDENWSNHLLGQRHKRNARIRLASADEEGGTT